MEVKIIKQKDFKDFCKGKLGNGGQNIYVSRKGIIQRIHYFDVNKDGYVDLPFANSHDDETRIPAYVYTNPLETIEHIELPTDGAFTGTVVDLNNDGYDDLIIANQYNGVSNDVYAQIYYGSSEGMSEKRMMKLWAPSSTGVAAGDFNGDGRKDIAFISRGKLRIFYQEEYGFRANGYIDLDIEDKIQSIDSEDLDGDGYADLVVKLMNSDIKIFWGGPGGISIENTVCINDLMSSKDVAGNLIDKAASGASGDLLVYKMPDSRGLKIVKLKGQPHIFDCVGNKAVFIPIERNRQPGEIKIIDSGPVTGAAVGDINGDGFEDIVLSSRKKDENGKEYSWIYWGSDNWYSNSRRTAVHTMSARDVVVGDIDGDGFDDIVFCQDKTEELYSIESFIYKGGPGGAAKEPVRLPTHCAANAFIARTYNSQKPQVIFLNHLSNRINGYIPSYIYLGGLDGFKHDKKIELMGWAPTELRICDFNDDGYPEIFISNCNENALHLRNGSYIYKKGPDGYSEENRIELPTHHTMSACCADINKDGYLDIIAAGFDNNEILIFYGSENGFEEEPKRLTLDFSGVKCGVKSKEPRYMTLADFNNDGWLDLVVPMIDADYFAILWGSEEGFSTNNVSLIPAEKTLSSRAADLDGDGWLDIIIGGYNGLDQKDPFNTFVYIYWGGPEGFSNERRTQLPANFACDISIADFNNDGILDIFVACYHGLRTRDLDSYIYWGSEGGIYSAGNRKRLFCHSACGALTADFNEDGWIDLAVANHKTNGNHPGDSFIWWNGPEGFSESNITRLPTLGTHGITHVDTGNIMDRSDEEYYISALIDLSQGTAVTMTEASYYGENENTGLPNNTYFIKGISWVAETPPKTWVRAQIRTALSREELNNSRWVGPDGENSWFENDSNINTEIEGKWVQYRLALGAVNSGSTPRVSEVSIAYDTVSKRGELQCSK